MVTDESPLTAEVQLDRIRQAFERAEIGGDTSVIDEHCADDIVAMPPGQPPTVGNEASKQGLGALFEAFDVDVEYTSEEVVVGTELAFDRLTARETHTPKDGGEPVEHTVDSLWVYRREPDGEWKQVRAIWNYRD